MSQLNGFKPHKSSVTKSVASLARDAVELGELQLELIKLDTAEAVRKFQSTIVLAAIGAFLLIACLPVALHGVAEALVEFADWTRPVAFGASVGVGLGVSAIVLGFSWSRLKKGLASWRRSSEEFSRNIEWLKSALEDDDISQLGEKSPSSRYPK